MVARGAAALKTTGQRLLLQFSAWVMLNGGWMGTLVGIRLIFGVVGSGEDASEGVFLSEGEEAGANGASTARTLSRSGTGGEISTKIVCAGVFENDPSSSIAALSDAGRISRLENRRRWPRERAGSRGKAESRALEKEMD